MFYKRCKSALLPLSMFALMVAFAAMFAASSASAAPSPKSRSTSTNNGTGTLLVSVLDAQSREIVTGAQLTVRDTNANVVATGVVDSSNTADTDGVQFSLAQGNYKVEISAQGYATTDVVMSVISGETSQYDVELQK